MISSIVIDNIITIPVFKEIKVTRCPSVAPTLDNVIKHPLISKESWIYIMSVEGFTVILAAVGIPLSRHCTVCVVSGPLEEPPEGVSLITTSEIICADAVVLMTHKSAKVKNILFMFTCPLFEVSKDGHSKTRLSHTAVGISNPSAVASYR